MFETVEFGVDFLPGVVVALSFTLFPALGEAIFQPLPMPFFSPGFQAILVTLLAPFIEAVFPRGLANLVNVCLLYTSPSPRD